MQSALPSTSDGDAILNGFLTAVSETGVDLYPAQEEAVLELIAGKNVILCTPTGSGKSLVATAMHFKAMAEKKRSFYTSPIKALVSEKFFNLCKDFGPQNVGMITGDSSINRDAPIICCTAEILSNMALSEGAQAMVDYAIMDEFHYYSDRERGVAWQIPLLTLKNTRFLLMSATLGDVRVIEDCLKQTTGQDVATVRSQDRPVPLDFKYVETPIHETLSELISSNRSPVYVVNFTQNECVEQAQNAMSVNFCTKEEKKKIEETFLGFRFDTPFGKEIRRLISHGIGLHHAGLLPKYRLLIEKLAQEGLLKIIMGTDTLGVGVNIPIRSVLFTKLCKFDGQKTGILSVRDFKQISGRAGRKGFDDAGSVVVQAPEHVIENKRGDARFSADKNKKNKFVKKSAPTKNYVHWDEQTFKRLMEQMPESLQSQFVVSHGMMLTLFQGQRQNTNVGYRRLIDLIGLSHEASKAKSKHRKQARLLFKSLLSSQIVSLVSNQMTGRRIVINANLEQDFSLHHTLAIFLLDALPRLDSSAETHAVDVLSLVESILENPRTILFKQIDKLKGEKIAELKGQGVEYDARMEELEKIEHPKPLREFIYETFNTFADKHPWLGEENIQPKSIAREMFERLMTFNEYVSEYGLQRSEGLLLRYLSDCYKTLAQTVPESFKTEGVWDVLAFLRQILGKVDTSLIQEWEQLRAPKAEAVEKAPEKPRLPFDPELYPKAFLARIRAELHGFVKAIAKQDYADALQWLRAPDWTEERLKNDVADFFTEHGSIIVDPRFRQPNLTQVQKIAINQWRVRQVLLDPSENNDWFVEGVVIWEETQTADLPLVQFQSIST